MDAHPRYILFAGINGAGKSTLYRSGLWAERAADLEIPRVNSDEIITQQGWDWSSRSDQEKAGRLAIGRIKQHMATRESFNQETTLSGRFVVKNIQQAHEMGYLVQLNYVGVDAVQIALERIAHRVMTGGHDIDPVTVKRRYVSSINNLRKVIPYCESVALYDNTHQMQLVGFWLDGVAYDCSQGVTDATWFKGLL